MSHTIHKDLEICKPVSLYTPFVDYYCFHAGMHYWYDRYNEGENMSCDDTFPAFLLYDSDGLLTGFGWAFNLNFGKSSYRWEHPLRATYRVSYFLIPLFFFVDKLQAI